MGSEIEKVEQSMVAKVDKETIQNYLFTSDTTLTEKQQEMFLQIASRNNLDPFKREIYAIAYGNEFSIVTGYEVYIQRAERTGKLSGWSCVNTEAGAKLTIHRSDWEQPFEWEVDNEEFNKEQSSWKKIPRFMIKKVCIGQGFRLAFPDELGGLPYLKEEMQGSSSFNKTPTKIESGEVSYEEEGSDSEPNEEASSDNEVMTRIAKVTLQKSKPDADKKWTKYIVHSTGGTEYTSFDKKIAEEARRAATENKECLIVFTYLEKFKSNEINILTVLDE
jgi:phage recombination protein Bet